MNWLLDRLLLIVTAVALGAAAWAFYRFTGEWAAPILLTVTFISLIADNFRLRKLLRDNGIDARSARHQRWEQRKR